MSLSEKERTENLNLAARTLLSEVGEQFAEDVVIVEDNPAFKSIYPTTWKEMWNQRWLKDSGQITQKEYYVTSFGWLEAILLLKIETTPDFRKRMGKLAACLKRFVKGKMRTSSYMSKKYRGTRDSH